jgi:sortase A
MAVTQQRTGEPRRSGVRRGLFWSGTVLVVAGLVLLGYVVWEFYGTNIVSHHKQQQIVKELNRQWRSGAGANAEGGGVEVGDASALVRIPRFGADYVVPVLEGISDDVLAQGFGHFTQTAGPGREGNYALAGHRVTHGEPLRDMPELRPGDKVVVETRRDVYTYVLDTDPNRLVVPFTAGWVLDELPTNPEPGGVQPAQVPGQRLITLTTCSDLFHTDDRMIAFGHLASTTRKPR